MMNECFGERDGVEGANALLLAKCDVVDPTAIGVTHLRFHPLMDKFRPGHNFSSLVECAILSNG